MFLEFALEPSLLASWEAFRYFTGKFGVHEGRLISRYPKRWKKLVYESLSSCGDYERKRIEEQLAQIDMLLMPRRHDWNPSLKWRENAEIEHSARPFHAIIAATNPGFHEAVLLAEHISDLTPPAKWQARRSMVVRRDAKSLAAAIAPLLRRCESLLFIDPHFGPGNARHRRTLEAMLEAAIVGRCGPLPARVEIHTGDKVKQGFADDCSSRLPQIVPKGIELRVVR